MTHAGVCPGVCHNDREAQIAERQNVAFVYKLIGPAAIARKIRASVEQSAEGLLHRGDVAADDDATTEFTLEIWRRREVIGVHVSLEQPVDAEPEIAHPRNCPVSALRAGAS